MKDIEEKQIVNNSLQLWQEAYEARKPIEVIWQKVYNLYNNQYDFSKKAEWQSKQYLPKISNAVRAIVGFVKKAITQEGDWFTVKFLNEKFSSYEPVLKRYILYWLNINKFNQIFDEALICGLLSNLMIFKVYWKTSQTMEGTTIPQKSIVADIKEEKEKTLKDIVLESLGGSFAEAEKEFLSMYTEELKIAVVDPFDFFIDPTGRYKYVIHRITMDLSDLKEIAEKSNYNMKVVEQIEEDYRKQEFEYKEAVRKGMAITKKPTFRKQVELWEFWGDLFDEYGNIIFRNCTWTIANEKYLIRGPIENPFWHKKAPFIWGPIIKRPLSVYHKNFFEDSIGLAFVLTELLNMMIDTNSYATAKAFEIDMDLLYKPEELTTGIYPGKVFKKRGGGANLPLIREISLGQVSPQILRIYQEMDREFQNATGTTEFLLGKPATRGRPTATEVAIKSQQSSAFIEDIASCIEDNVLSPLLKMMAILILQYQRSFDDIRFVEIQEDIKNKMKILAALPDEEKRKLIDIFNFEVKGISGLINKRQNIEKLLNFLEFIMNTPVADYINFSNVLKQIASLLDLDTEDLLLPEEYVQKMRLLKMQQEILLSQLKGGKGYDKKRKTPSIS